MMMVRATVYLVVPMEEKEWEDYDRIEGKGWRTDEDHERMGEIRGKVEEEVERRIEEGIKDGFDVVDTEMMGEEE